MTVHEPLMPEVAGLLQVLQPESIVRVLGCWPDCVSVHSPEMVAVSTVPEVQQVAAPGAESLPRGQGRQTEALVAVPPVLTEYRPAWQLVQAEAFPGLQVPAGQKLRHEYCAGVPEKELNGTSITPG